MLSQNYWHCDCCNSVFESYDWEYKDYEHGLTGVCPNCGNNTYTTAVNIHPSAIRTVTIKSSSTSPTITTTIWNLLRESSGITIKAALHSSDSVRKVVFICSRFRGDEQEVKGNLDTAMKLCLLAMENGYAPLAPHLIYPCMLDDSVSSERRLGIECGLALLKASDIVWIYIGDGMSEGMKAEAKYAYELKKPIRVIDKDELSFIGYKDIDVNCYTCKHERIASITLPENYPCPDKRSCIQDAHYTKWEKRINA